uniref:RanBP2-type domain-containing protein n=1 Tax=Alexandrium monilatum TaxID=311494 RepID=A0A7S4SBG2_9DINO|mmetsp:Transcript_27638/g.82442  ORF Transcript_27638/g.82442 Transcript_27638/m.82442 type:complete len:310 (+) Transcript_27638:80-1009(+)
MAFLGDFVFTSSQAEALCKARPPRGPKKTPALPASPCKLKDCPQLNFDDLPEALLHGRGGLRRCRGMGMLAVAPRPRVKSLGLPRLDEGHAAEEGECALAWEAEAEVKEDSQWSCIACTFLNSGLLGACEMCQTQREIQPPKDLPAGRVPDGDEDWPVLQPTPGDGRSLPEEMDSWVDCEVSSVGSSWLDIDSVQADQAEDAGLVLASSAPQALTAPEVVTWATKARAAAGPGPAARAPVPRAAVPPARRAPQARQVRPAREEGEAEEEDPDLLELEERRLQPRTSMGATHRRIMAQWCRNGRTRPRRA